MVKLSYAEVRAPVTGIVTNLALKTGEFVEAGDLLLAVVDTSSRWVEVNLKEVDLEHIQIGQAAIVILDKDAKINAGSAMTKTKRLRTSLAVTGSNLLRPARYPDTMMANSGRITLKARLSRTSLQSVGNFRLKDHHAKV